MTNIEERFTPVAHSTNNFWKIVSLAVVFVWSHNPYPLLPSSSCGGALRDQTNMAACETNRKRNLRDDGKCLLHREILIC